jgi:hypothetical protein
MSPMHEHRPAPPAALAIIGDAACEVAAAYRVEQGLPCCGVAVDHTGEPFPDRRGPLRHADHREPIAM